MGLRFEGGLATGLAGGLSRVLQVETSKLFTREVRKRLDDDEDVTVFVWRD